MSNKDLRAEIESKVSKWFGEPVMSVEDEIEALITSKAIEELENVLEIPGKYIDDGTMVYWSDFNADTLEKLIRDRINTLKEQEG
jgi:hypothetical protein